MLQIRLARSGVKNNPVYRIVVIESHRKVTGKTLDVVGHWHPSKKIVKIDQDKVADWVSKGAKVTNSVAKLSTSQK